MVSPPADCTGKVEASPSPVSFAPRAVRPPPRRDWGTRGDSSRAPGSAVPALEPAPRVPAQVNRSRPALGSPARLFPPQRQRVPALVHVARRLDRPTWRELVTADHAPARLPPIQRNRPSTRLLHRVELRQLPPSLVLVHLRSPFSEPGPPARPCGGHQQGPSTSASYADVGPLGHPDHLRVPLVRSTRRPCLAPSIIARESLFPSAQGVLFSVAISSRAPAARPVSLVPAHRAWSPSPCPTRTPRPRRPVEERAGGLYPGAVLEPAAVPQPRFRGPRIHPRAPADHPALNHPIPDKRAGFWPVSGWPVTSSTARGGSCAPPPPAGISRIHPRAAADQCAEDATLAGYLAELHEQGRAPSSASTAVAAARFRARLAVEPSPAGERTARVLAGYRRTAGERGRGQARPFGAVDLAAVLATCQRPRRRVRGVESDEVAVERGRLDAVIAWLLFMAGMRRREVSALRWADVAAASAACLSEGPGRLPSWGDRRLRTALAGATPHRPRRWSRAGTPGRRRCRSGTVRGAVRWPRAIDAQASLGLRPRPRHGIVPAAGKRRPEHPTRSPSPCLTPEHPSTGRSGLCPVGRRAGAGGRAPPRFRGPSNPPSSPQPIALPSTTTPSSNRGG